MKLCIIGGGSTYTPELIQGLINISPAVRFDEICMLDVEPGARKLGILADFARRMLAAAGLETRLTTTLDAQAAITGADFILSQFRAGGLSGRVADEKIPLAYGLIGQETTGMGGMANALRALPIVERYVDLARRHSNQAWIINFTNPSGLLTEFMLNYLDYERCIGLCNCPITFLVQAAVVLGCLVEDVFLRYYGLNHLSWVDGVSVHGVDRTAEVLNFLKLNMRNIPDLEFGEHFIPTLRMLPNPYLRYYYNTRQMLAREIADRNGAGTRGEVILAIEEKLLRLYAEPERTQPPEELSQRGGFMYSTVAIELVRSLATDDGKMHIVNTRNRGAVQDFPDDYVMEIPVKVGGSGPETIALGKAAKSTIGLINTIKNYERLTIEGFLQGDEGLVKQAMLIHPLGPDEADLETLWAELKQANAGWFTRLG